MQPAKQLASRWSKRMALRIIFYDETYTDPDTQRIGKHRPPLRKWLELVDTDDPRHEPYSWAQHVILQNIVTGRLFLAERDRVIPHRTV